MVSLQANGSPGTRKASPGPESPPSKKRRWQDDRDDDTIDFAKERRLWRAELIDVELHLDTPLPLEWQRCLDIKSGQIHFYNIRTHKRTSRDPRRCPEPRSSSPGLDLELNLTCDPPSGLAEQESAGIPRSLSWVSLDADHREMVAGVCMHCHMLVMMCKASPSCPNCKLVQSSSELRGMKKHEEVFEGPNLMSWPLSSSR